MGAKGVPRASLGGSSGLSATTQVFLLLVCPAWLALMICAEMRCDLLGSCGGERALGVTERWLPKGQTQLIQVTQNPEVAEAGRSLRAPSTPPTSPACPEEQVPQF